MSSTAKSRIVIALLVLMFVGVYLGPYQYFNQDRQAGESVTSREINLDSPMTVALTPEMNPIQINGTIEFQSPSDDAAPNSFECVLSDPSGKKLWKETFHATVKRRHNKRGLEAQSENGSQQSEVEIKEFDVVASGAHKIHVAGVKGTTLENGSMKLDVRRNVRATNLTTAIAGFAMLAIGFLGTCWACSQKVTGAVQPRKAYEGNSKAREPEVAEAQVKVEEEEREPALTH